MSRQDESALSELSTQLSLYTYTNFERAHTVLDALTASISIRTPFDIRLNYHRCAAFLYNQWQQYDTALEHARQAIPILENLSDVPGLVEVWSDTSAIYLNRRAWPQVQECLERARRLLNDASLPELRAYVDCREGYLHLNVGKLREATDCLLRAEKNLMSLPDDAPLKMQFVLTMVLAGLGDLYEKLGEQDKSLDYYRRVLPIIEAHGLRPRAAWHYLNAGRGCMARNDYRQAKNYFDQALQFAEEGDTEAQTHILGNLGILALVSGDDTEEALTLLERAATQYEKPEKAADFNNLSKIEFWRAGIYARKDEWEKTEQYLLRAWEAGQAGHDKYHLAQICQNIASLKADKADYEGAYEWQTRVTSINREYFAELRDRERSEIEAGHELERSRQEAQMARLRVSSLQLRALRSQMNPHFMFNALNAIQGLITSGMNNDAESYLAKFARMMRQTLDYSDLELVTLDQEIEFLERYLDINKKLRFRDRLDFRIEYPADLELDEIKIPTMILQPFVENAIEHGIRPRQEGRIVIRFEQEEDEDVIRCIIEDDGVGYKQGRAKQNQEAAFQRHRSRGMEITYERLQLLHQLQHRLENEDFIKIIDLSDLPNSKVTGTRVTVRLPAMDDLNLTLI